MLLSLLSAFTAQRASQVLTMELLEGVPLTDLEGISENSQNPEQTLINALNARLSL